MVIVNHLSYVPLDSQTVKNETYVVYSKESLCLYFGTNDEES